MGPHPTDMMLSNRTPEDGEAEENAKKPKKEEKTLRLFVAAANTNTVFVVSVEDDKEMKVTETLNVALTPRHPLGMTPTALAISADQRALFTVCSDANAVAVTDISEQRSRLRGIYSDGLVSDGGARFEGRHDSGAEWARVAELSESKGSGAVRRAGGRGRRRSAARVRRQFADGNDVGDPSFDG